jgi:hypothetical protein
MTKMTRAFAVLLAAALAPAAFAQSANNPFHVDGAPACALDWREVGGGAARVIYLGDVRSSAAIKRVLAGAMLDFARAGAGALAVESLRASDQPLLDRYDASARRRLGERLGKSAGAPAEETLKLFDAARAAGLSLAALAPDAGTEDADGSAASAALAALSRRPGGGKVLVLLDAESAKRGARPAKLADAGVASRTYAFAAAGDPGVKKLVTAGLDGGRWLLPGGADYDGLVSVPEVLRETPAR